MALRRLHSVLLRWRFKPNAAEINIERNIALVLRIGVALSTICFVIGLVLYLLHNPERLINYRVFQGEPASYRQPSQIIDLALAGRGRAIIQLGLLILMLTPFARVVYLWTVFFRQKDWSYTVLVSIVMVILAVGFHTLVTG